MRALAISLLIVLLAGCLGAADPAVETATSPGAAPRLEVGERPDPSFGNVTTGVSAGADLDATLERAPVWVPGEWWRIAFESPLTGESVEFVRVVAAVDGDQYVVGMPHEGWYKEAVLFHTPALGDVNVNDLSYDTHDELFTPLKFPLTDGATWTTKFSGRPDMTATVKVDPAENVAVVTFTAPDNGLFGVAGGDGEPQTVMELVYDPKIHEVRELNDFFSVKYQVIDHGYGFQGWVTVPRGEDLIFFNGRVGPALSVTGGPAAPTEMVTVDGGYNRVTFFQFAGSITPAPGHYSEKVLSPDGKEYITTSDTGALVTSFFEHANPDGEWAFEHVTGGAGLTFTEGVAYHQYDIRLPDGLRRSDHAHDVVR